MSTISIAKISNLDDSILQGDIYKNVRYNYIDSEDESSVQILEFEFPLAIVISQACDVTSMEELFQKGGGKPTKFMPSILMCPIYDIDSIKTGNHIQDAYKDLDLTYVQENLFNSSEFNVAKKDWHYRYHALDVKAQNEMVIEKSVIDFKQYFTVPISYLVEHKNERILHLEDLYAEQITLKFATFLTRVAIPATPEDS